MSFFRDLLKQFGLDNLGGSFEMPKPKAPVESLEKFKKESDPYGDNLKKLAEAIPFMKDSGQTLGVSAKGNEVMQPTPEPSPRFLQSTDEFEKIAVPLAKKYGVPEAIAMGQYAAEGRVENGGLGAKRNNFYNIAAFDSNPDAAFNYDTPEAGIEEYMKFITGQGDRYASPTVKQKFADAFNEYKKTGNVFKFLVDIESAGYAGDPSTYGQRANNGFDSYSDFIMNTPEFKKYYGNK